MKHVLIVATLLAIATPASADYRRPRVHLFGVTQFPSHWLLDRGPRIVNVPTRMDGSLAVEFNDNPNWGRNCRSCFDASK